ncbi:DUF2867 domain-containing protein [Motilimonas sp. KMU-193]|uniref:DUF2867 domain-containing protein n=1 Tax=Motilimonas sp. KMU-193 TaxID=3388668 RepID=UPI00396B290F
MNILVIGALGTVGRHLVPRLIAAGHHVSISSRSATKPVPWRDLPHQRFTVDLLQPDSIAAALQDIDVVYYLMHGMTDGQHYTQTEQQAAHNLVAAVQGTKVKRIIYLGSLVSGNPKSEHMLSRVSTGHILAGSAIPVTEVRAGIIVAPGSAAFEVMRDVVGHIPIFFAPSSVKNLAPPIALDNLIYYLVELINHPSSAGQIYDATGPEWISYKHMMQIIAKKLSKSCQIIAIKGLPVSWTQQVLGIITSVPKPLAKALLAGLDEPLQGSGLRIQTLIPQTLLSFEQAVDAVLATEKIRSYPKRWQDGIPEFRNFSPLHGFYAKRAAHSIRIKAHPAKVWQVLNRLGGKDRYFYANALWAMREWIDQLVGGHGRLHGRDNTEQFIVGERVDSWRILSVIPERLLVMKFGMKAPGGGGMQLSITPINETDSAPECNLTIELLWHPAGFWGLAYWYFFAPWHALLLHGMADKIASLALQLNHAEHETVQQGVL